MKSKTAVSALALIGSLMSAHAQEKYVIDGTIRPQPKDLTMHLYYHVPDKGLRHDSCRVEAGKFSFKGDVPSGTLGFLVVLADGQSLNQYMSEHAGLPKDQVGIYMETGQIKVSLDEKGVESVRVSGTFNNDAVQEARPIIWKYKHAEEALNQTAQAAGEDQAKRADMLKAYNKMVNERTQAVGGFIKAHPAALASLDLLKRWVNPSDDLENAKKFYSWLSEDLKKSHAAAMYALALEQSAKVDVNSIAPDFQLKDTAGVLHHLSEYKGKYVLVDFWASWCGPCLREMPNVVDAYNAFKNKNFEIVGVSLDGGSKDAREHWIDAFQHEGMKWTQLSDLEGWNSPVAKLYMVNSIPANFLLGPDGKILAKNLKGEDLKEALNKYL